MPRHDRPCLDRRTPSLRLALCFAAALCGCAANPLVDVPERSVEGEVPTMASALARARQLKEGYHRKAYDFVGTQVALNDTLLGLGVLTLGLAASSGVHPDAYRGTALLGGAAYLFGVQNTGKSRLDVYQNGIGAVNCATLASLPLQVGSAELVAITEDARRTKLALPAFSRSLARVEAEFAAVGGTLTPNTSQAIEHQINASRKARAAALAALADAAGLPAQVGAVAKQLKATLDLIEVQVNKTLASTVADPATVLASLGSLATLAGRFAPGRSVEAFFTARQGATTPERNRGRDGPSALPPALADALLDLASRRAELEADAVPLAQRLLPYQGHTEASATALKACGVASVASSLQIDPDELHFSAGASDMQSRIVSISGGVKPYIVRFRESPTLGIEAPNPVAGDSTVVVTVPKGAVEGTALTLLVMDAASPPQMKPVRVRVGTDKTSWHKSLNDIGAAHALLPFEEAAQSLLAAGKTRLKAQGGVNTYTLVGSAHRGDELLLITACQPGVPAVKDRADPVRIAFVAHDFVHQALPLDPGPRLTRHLKSDADTAACGS